MDMIDELQFRVERKFEMSELGKLHFFSAFILKEIRGPNHCHASTNHCFLHHNANMAKHVKEYKV